VVSAQLVHPSRGPSRTPPSTGSLSSHRPDAADLGMVANRVGRRVPRPYPRTQVNVGVVLDDPVVVHLRPTASSSVRHRRVRSMSRAEHERPRPGARGLAAAQGISRFVASRPGAPRLTEAR
jgi:hypothetical protein